MKDGKPVVPGLKELTEWLDAVGDTIVDFGRRIKYLPSVEIERIRKHLQVASISEVASVSSMLSRYHQFIQTAVLEDYLRENNLKVVDKAQFDLSEGGQKGAFEYVDLEVDVDKVIKAVGYGHLFLVHEPSTRRFVLQVDEWGYERYKIRVFAKDELQSEALKIITELDKYAKSHNVLKGKKITPYFRHIKTGKNTWDSVILPEKIKRELRKNIDLLLQNVELYKKNGMTFKRGIILKGLPGTGKTLIGKVLCNVSDGTTFIWVTPGDLDEARRIKLICELARELSPSILFLEDIDLYGAHRERENRGVLGELMNQLDGLVENEFVIVVATTNKPEEIEDALRNRPGRFDRVVDIPLPDLACRETMFEVFLSKINVATKNLTKLIKVLAEKTDGYTGAHVKELVNSAIISAIDEGSIDGDGKVIIKVKHFEDNIEIVRHKKIEAVGFASSTKTQSKYDMVHDFTDCEDDDDD